MLKVHLNSTELNELERIKSNPSSEISEKALYILMSHEGISVTQIAKTLKRNPHTVRDWIKRYNAEGLNGLQRKFSKGRPSTLREKVSETVKEIIDDSPSQYGYPVSSWTVLVLKDYLQKRGVESSEDTIERALKDLDYRYKRTAKAVPENAPTKKEKKRIVTNMINRIKTQLKNDDCEVFALDESHFSTDPYVSKGWQKKLWTVEDSGSNKTREDVTIWMLKFENAKILLEERKQRK